MDKPTTLRGWDFPDTVMVPDGYNMTDVPKATDANFRILLENYNKLVEYVLESEDE